MGKKANKEVIIIMAMVLVLLPIFVSPLASLALAQEKAVKLKVDTMFIEPTHFSQAMKYWAESVEKETGGRIKCDMFYGDQLVSQTDQWDAARDGIIQVTDIAASYVSSKVSALSPIEIPALSRENFREARAKIAPILEEITAQEGLKPISVMYVGQVIYVHRSKLLKTAGDFERQVIRAAGRWSNRWTQLLGASPTFIPAGELYQAVQRGVVDGAGVIGLMIPALKLDEVAPYITFSGGSAPNMQIVVMNLKTFKGLSQKDQEILLKAGKDAERVNWELTTGFDDKVMDQMKAKGRHVYRMTDEELKQTYKKALPMWDEVRKASGPLGNKLADALEVYKP